MIRVWSTGKLATENPIFFRSDRPEKAYLLYHNTKTLLPTQSVGREWQGEFRVSLPGAYTLQIASEKYPFEIQQYERFSIQFELVLTVLAVALFFVVIFKKRKGVYGK